MHVKQIFLALVMVFSVGAGALNIRAELDNGYWDENFGVPGCQFGVADILAVQNRLFVAGNILNIGGVDVGRVAQWDGTNWSALGSADFEGLVVRTLDSDGTHVFVGGTFQRIGGVEARNIAQWDGREWSALGAGVGRHVYSLQVIGTDLYVGGGFEEAGDGLAVRGLARWDGDQWWDVGGGVTGVGYSSTFPPELIRGTATVLAMATDGANLYVGGGFDQAGEVEAHAVAKWDGKEWSPLGRGLRRNQNPPYNARVVALAWAGGRLYAGGTFRFAGDINAVNIAYWDGQEWHPLGSGVDDLLSVQTILPTGNGDVYVGGVFQRIGGIEANRIARWDGERWWPLGEGTNRGVTALEELGGKLFVGGVEFSLAGNKPSTNIALWHIPRTLEVQREEDDLKVSWPKPDEEFLVEGSAELDAADWTPLSVQPELEQNRWTIRQPATEPQKFFRLRKVE